ncbi:MAG TPA: electron transfer flavoprotein subunit alpha/FixB family protein [Syntrophales bacterium]|nr:electron transfer flavoprotein subunit alpha/FixB family protein [Syntrophales bacterium]
MAGIWIFAEHAGQALELLHAAQSLVDAGMGGELTAFSWPGGPAPDELGAGGADEVLMLPALAEDQPLEAYAPAILVDARQERPDLLLFAATARGKDLAAQIAAGLDAGLCSGCISLHWDKESKTLEMERLLYGGAAVQRIAPLAFPVLAAVPPGTFRAGPGNPGREPRIRHLMPPPASPVAVQERKPRQRLEQDISASKVVVCAGRGFEKREDLALARELADALGGALACTRPLSEEMHWLPEDLCIGLSGIQVKPDVYIGIGVSGQVQHLTGIRGAKVVCAVNRDEQAPIFAAADLGVVGDLYAVLPRLLQALKEAASS